MLQDFTAQLFLSFFRFAARRQSFVGQLAYVKHHDAGEMAQFRRFEGGQRIASGQFVAKDDFVVRTLKSFERLGNVEAVAAFGAAGFAATVNDKNWNLLADFD